jgi:asparagine synthetase B (glutamine-hydrolysing)
MAMACMSLTGINATRNTFFTNIKKLMSGETIVYDVERQKNQTQQERHHCSPHPTNDFSEEEFRFEANQTVKMCTLGMRKIGVFLSGGLDSSLVAHELKKDHRRGQHFYEQNGATRCDTRRKTYNDDARCAAILASHEGYNHREVICTPKTSWWNIGKTLCKSHRTTYVQSFSGHVLLYQQGIESNNDIVVTMAGDMGDELLGGYTKYWSLRNGKWGNNKITF